MSKETARARVQVTLEIDVPDSWGHDCKVEQIYDQAAESALGMLRQGLVVDGMTNTGLARSREEAERRPRVSVVGKPEITAILLKPERP